MKSINIENLTVKINDLFDYRLFPQLLELGSDDSSIRKSFKDQLIDLQSSIYFLDAHLEEGWNTSPTILAERWNLIYQSLRDIGVQEDDLKEYCAHIYKYEKRELALRRKVMPLHLKLEYFYFYKSCDVKLCRRLIYEKFDGLRQHASLADWRYFDLVTEVNDDVEDLFEDLETINCNRFMISIGKLGPDKTREDFLAFLDLIKSKSDLRFMADMTPLQEEIKKKTDKNIEETKLLLISNLNSISADQIDKSILFQNLLK